MNYFINSVWNFIKANPILVLVAALVLVLILWWFADAISGQVERFNQWRFAKAVAAKQVTSGVHSDPCPQTTVAST